MYKKRLGMAFLTILFTSMLMSSLPLVSSKYKTSAGTKFSITFIGTIQHAEGIGYVCVCGGLSCMPGFPELVVEKLTDVGAINPELEYRYPTDPDGVTAPAYGAYMLAELLEEERGRKKKKTW